MNGAYDKAMWYSPKQLAEVYCTLPPWVPPICWCAHSIAATASATHAPPSALYSRSSAGLITSATGRQPWHAAVKVLYISCHARALQGTATMAAEVTTHSRLPQTILVGVNGLWPHIHTLTSFHYLE